MLNLPPTEQRHPASMQIDQMSPLELATFLNREDAQVVEAVSAVLTDVARAIEMIAGVLEGGGRWFLLGAGTSGRLALLDVLDMESAFNLPQGMVIALLVGGSGAAAAEGAEDDVTQGAEDLRRHAFSSADILLGASASGRTPYVLGALQYARGLGATTIALACNPVSPMAGAADLAIEPLTGPEVLTGSTRLKAGMAQKMVLNMLSTGVMVRLGKVYTNLMVDLRPSSRKLRERAVRVISAAADVDDIRAEQLLAAAGWEVKTAAVMALAGVPASAARQRLAAGRGHVRRALELTDLG